MHLDHKGERLAEIGRIHCRLPYPLSLPQEITEQGKYSNMCAVSLPRHAHERFFSVGHCPRFLSGCSHVGSFFLAHTKIQTPKRKVSAEYKPHYVYTVGTVVMRRCLKHRVLDAAKDQLYKQA